MGKLPWLDIISTEIFSPFSLVNVLSSTKENLPKSHGAGWMSIERRLRLRLGCTFEVDGVDEDSLGVFAQEFRRHQLLYSAVGLLANKEIIKPYRPDEFDTIWQFDK